MIKQKEQTTVCIVIPRQLKSRLQRKAKERNISFNAIIRMISSEWLSKNE